jgi:hypothetical protein
MLKPIQPSIYTFRRIINGGFIYIDKTRYLYELVRYAAGVYFLARPRRFGKSLTISTLEEIFLGNKELFRGLFLYDSDYQWESYPVLRIDFSLHRIRNSEELEVRIKRHLSLLAQRYGVTLVEAPFDIQFEDLILKLATTHNHQQVVILIDEYDKPIIDNLENLPEAERIRDTLKSFYTIIKAMDQYIRFAFITGISKFTRVGIFSGLNNLTDLTFNPRFATLIGLTEEEIKQALAPYITNLATAEGMTEAIFVEKMRQWYDGFCFVHGCENVYNPFSVLNLFYQQRFANYWFESGTPTFLIKLIQERGYDIRQLDRLELTELGFSTYEIEHLEIVPLLFQTGYLTIQGYDPTSQRYQLGYPNNEVQNSFLTYLLSAFSTVPKGFNEGHLWGLIDALTAHKLDEFFAVLKVFFANIPYDLHLAQEKYYQTIFYLVFRLLGIYTEAEVKTNDGRIDAVVELKTDIFLFEFKLDDSAKEALKQIKEHEYAQKYRGKGKPITLVGANFDSEKRTVTTWKSEIDKPGTTAHL